MGKDYQLEADPLGLEAEFKLGELGKIGRTTL